MWLGEKAAAKVAMYTPIETRSLLSVSLLTQPDPGRSAGDALPAIATGYLSRSLEVPTGGLTPGMSQDQVAQSHKPQLTGLPVGNPEVVQLLLSAGMAPMAVSAYASTVSLEEAKSAPFIQVLHDKLVEGLPAGEAILWARFSATANENELRDPQFIQDLTDAGAKGFGVSASTTLQFARARRLARRLDIPLSQTLHLSPDQLRKLLTLDASILKPSLSVGRSLAELADTPPETLAALQKVGPTLLQWLVQTTKANPADIAQLSEAEITDLQYVMDNGSRLATHDEVVKDIKPETVSRPINLGSGTIAFETQSGQKILAIRQINPGLYNQALGILTERAQGQVDAARTRFGLPPQAEVNVIERSTQKLNDEADPSSGYASINQSVIKKLLDNYRGMLDRNEITKDDPRAQLIRTFEARSALANGYSLLPYYEADGGFGGTYRTYPGGPDNPTYQTMSSADVHDLINEGEVNNRVLSGMSNETIQADYQAALNEEVSALPNKQALIDTLFTNLSSPNYIDALRALKDQGLCYEAEQMTQRDLMSLAMLDPAKSTEAAQQLRLNSVGSDFQELTDNPGLIEVQTFGHALYDSAMIAIQAIRRGAGIIRHGTQTADDLIKYINETLKDKQSVNVLSKVLRQLVIDAKTKSITNIADINQAQFNEAMAKTYVPLEMRGKVANFFATTQKFGVWGSIGASACVASFGYRLSEGAWGENSTPLSRWGAARDVIAFFSSVGHVAKGAAGAIDFFRNSLLGADPNSQLAWKTLGLDRTLPQVWGKTSFLPEGKSWSELWQGQPGPNAGYEYLPDTPPDSPRGSAASLQGYVDATDEMWTRYDDTAQTPGGLFADAADASRPTLQGAADRLGQIWIEATPQAALTKMPSTVARVGASAIKILHATCDLAGVADMVIGALGLAKGIKDGDGGMIAANSLGIVGGGALTAAGAISTAALFAELPAAVAASASPLFLVGALFAAGAFVVSAITTSVRRHNELQSSTDKQGEWFQDLANDGLAYRDWADKLEFLRYSFAWYGNDNTDIQRSHFEFQKSEWEYFQRTQGKDGSSLNRLNAELHQYTDKTWPDPVMQEVNSQTYW